MTTIWEAKYVSKIVSWILRFVQEIASCTGETWKFRRWSYGCNNNFGCGKCTAPQSHTTQHCCCDKYTGGRRCAHGFLFEINCSRQCPAPILRRQKYVTIIASMSSKELLQCNADDVLMCSGSLPSLRCNFSQSTGTQYGTVYEREMKQGGQWVLS